MSGIMNDVGEFFVNSKGVYFQKQNSEAVFVCSKVEIIAKVRTNENKGWGRSLRIEDDDGVVHHFIMAMEELAGNSQELIAKMMSLGMKLGQGKMARDALIQYLSHFDPKKRGRTINQIGWFNDCFVLPDKVYGNDSDEDVIYQPPYDAKNSFQTKGTLSEWQENIGKYCSGNSRLIFAVSIAFAAPLLKLINQEGGGFHFRCSSSKGKTTTLVVAGSVWGGGGGNLGFVESWRNTANGLESVATQHNDSLLVLDELGQLNPKEAAEVTYLLANGKGKGRANQHGGLRRRSEWSLLFLSSGENSLLSLIEQAGARAYAGQEVRMIDIPAEIDGGFGLFEFTHGFSSPRQFADTLKSNSGQFYGTAIRHFLEYISQNKNLATNRIQIKMDEFRRICCEPNDASSEIGRVINRMALVAAAGELAVELKILPLENGEVTRATAKCLESWRMNRGGDSGLDTVRGLQNLKAFLLEFGSSRFPLISETQQVIEDRSHKRAGFRKDYGGGQEWFIFKDVFRKEICKGLDYKALEKRLIQDGILVPDNEGNPTTPQRIPGGGRVRVYVIHPSIFNETDVPPVPSVPDEWAP